MGVPYASTLCLFLFILYVNHLLLDSRKLYSEATLDADGTILYSSDVNLYKTCAKNKVTIRALYTSCNLNRWSINIDIKD